MVLYGGVSTVGAGVAGNVGNLANAAANTAGTLATGATATGLGTLGLATFPPFVLAGGLGLGFGIKALIDANRIKAANRRIGESNATANKYYAEDPFNSPYPTDVLKKAQVDMDNSANYKPMQNEMNRAFNDSGFYQKQANINDQIQGNMYREYQAGSQPSGLDVLSPAYQLFRQGLNLDGSRNYNLPEKKYSSLFQNGQIPYYDSTDPSTYGNKNNSYTPNPNGTLIGGTDRNVYNPPPAEKNKYFGGIPWLPKFPGQPPREPEQPEPGRDGTPEDLQRYYSETLRPLANMISNNTMVDMIDTIPIQQKQMQFLPTQQYNDSAFRPGGYFYGS